jgi:PBSX family phage terminase large subunit
MEAISFSTKQREVWRNTINQHHRWNVSYGATRSGKTFLDYWKIPWRIRHASKEGLILLLGNTKGTLERNILDPLRNMWTPALVGHVGSNNKVRLFGRECYALGADKINQVSKLQGVGLSYCYGDEVTTWHPDVFQMLKSRLDKPGACFDGTCNPDNPNHWFRQFIESDADVYSMGFTIDDNPFLRPEFVENLKREYTGTIFYDRFILGRWVAAEGLIYPGAANGQGIVPSIAREYTQYYVSVDYGTMNPFSAGLWGLCDGVWYRIREYYHSGRQTLKQRTDDEYYAELDRLIDGLPMRGVIVDPSAASFITLIRRKGRYSVVHARNDVLDGIRETARALSTGRVAICDCCKAAIVEFGAYRWDEKASEDKPIKENDHAMDDMRYFVYTILTDKNIGRVQSADQYGIY